MIFLGNAFSLQMLNIEKEVKVNIKPLSKEEFKSELGEEFVSAVGHADTAQVLSEELQVEVPMNRVFVSLGKDDTLLVAQLIGGRLPEGAITLPEGFEFKYFKVTLS